MSANAVEMKVKKRKIRRSREDKIYDAIIFAILTTLLLIVAYPLYFVIIASISEPAAVAGGKVTWLPIGLSFKGYAEVFKDDRIVGSFLNSLLYTVVGVSVNLIVTLPTAYALSRSKFQGKKIVTSFYLITMFISGGMIPTYLVVQKTHLLDTMWSLILPGAMGVYNMIVARSFFQQNISEELYEAAEIDGCGHGRFFFSIALPLSGAITAILVLYYGVGHWNSYFSALLYMSTKSKFPLQLVLRSILLQNEAQLAQSALSTTAKEAIEAQRQLAELMKYSLIIVSSIPVLVLYPFIQKHFVKGVMIGSVKG